MFVLASDAIIKHVRIFVSNKAVRLGVLWPFTLASCAVMLFYSSLIPHVRRGRLAQRYVACIASLY